MPRVLLTGAGGFLGRPCLERLRTRGHEVHAPGRDALDLFDHDAVSDRLARLRPERLLHLAWIATPGVFWTSPENERWVSASLHLLREFARHGGQRAVIAGSCAEYDWTGPGVCREDETPLVPTTLYGKSKLAMFWQASALAIQERLSLAWTRLFFLYGPGEHPGRLIPSVINAVLRGQPADCTEGTQQRDFIHVHDAAAALVALVESDAAGAFNVGSGTATAVGEVVRRIGDLLGALHLVRLGARPTPAGEPPLLVADLSHIRSRLGWSPTRDLGTGLAETIAWWRSRTHGAAA
jgi:nucleoside-diphosphate-sugar epimerase